MHDHYYKKDCFGMLRHELLLATLNLEAAPQFLLWVPHGFDYQVDQDEQDARRRFRRWTCFEAVIRIGGHVPADDHPSDQKRFLVVNGRYLRYYLYIQISTTPNPI